MVFIVKLLKSETIKHILPPKAVSINPWHKNKAFLLLLKKKSIMKVIYIYLFIKCIGEIRVIWCI